MSIEPDAELRERLIAKLREHGIEPHHSVHTAITHELDAIGRRYGVHRTAKVHRYWNETWQAEYSIEEPRPDAPDDREKIEIDIPLYLWERLQSAEKELEEVRERIASYFPNG